MQKPSYCLVSQQNREAISQCSILFDNPNISLDKDGTFKNKRPYTDEQFKKWMEWETHWKSRDRKILYEILNKHIEGWWD